VAGPGVTRFGHPHRHHRELDSTNARARALAEAGAPSGLVVTAAEQTAGRGRQGREWFAPAGSALLYSALLRPLADRPLLPLAAPLAVCDAVEALTTRECTVKWPNDVWIDERKVAGVLIEGRPEEDGGGWAIVGVGLNVAVPQSAFPEELRESATSLGDGASIESALAALNEALAGWVDAAPERVLEEFKRRDALRGRRISWQDGRGTAEGVDAQGHLLVRMEDGSMLAIGAGEVHLGHAGASR
jgi:BirA family biotin operon repressor/biotin-[acetyl-CoA-carboxylase] ligase